MSAPRYSRQLSTALETLLAVKYELNAPHVDETQLPALVRKLVSENAALKAELERKRDDWK